jgi:hypothetical protein
MMPSLHKIDKLYGTDYLTYYRTYENDYLDI